MVYLSMINLHAWFQSLDNMLTTQSTLMIAFFNDYVHINMLRVALLKRFLEGRNALTGHGSDLA